MMLITEEYLLNHGYAYDFITYDKGHIWLAPFENGYDVFLNGLQGGISGTVKYIHELIAIEAGLNPKTFSGDYKPEVIIPLDRIPEIYEKYKDKK